MIVTDATPFRDTYFAYRRANDRATWLIANSRYRPGFDAPGMKPLRRKAARLIPQAIRRVTALCDLASVAWQRECETPL